MLRYTLQLLLQVVHQFIQGQYLPLAVGLTTDNHVGPAVDPRR